MTDNLSFFFPDIEPSDGNSVPLPPQEVRFSEVRPEQVEDDGPKRFRLYVEISPFQVRPTIEIQVTDENGDEVSSASIIEPIMKKNVITMHLRGGKKVGLFTLNARLFVPEVCESDQRTFQFEIK